MRIRAATIGVLVAEGAVLLWLNLRMPAWLAEYRINTHLPPENLDPITTFLFFRGWPWTPCAYCASGLSQWHPDGYVPLAAWGDVLVFVLALGISGVTCEWLCRRWRSSMANNPQLGSIQR